MGAPKGHPRYNHDDRQWTATDTRQLKKLHGEGMSLSAIAAQTGWAKSIISRRSAACRPPLSWDRSRTEAATIAHSVDAKARRQELASRLYARGNKVLDTLEAPTYRKLVKGEYGSETVHALDFVPGDEERQMAAAAGQYLAAATKLEAIDSDSGQSAGRSLLEGLAAAFGITGDVDAGDG